MGQELPKDGRGGYSESRTQGGVVMSDGCGPCGRRDMRGEDRSFLGGAYLC